jgi:hypothetical protein
MKGLTTGQYMEQTVKAWEALAESVPNALTDSRSAAGGYAGPEN